MIPHGSRVLRTLRVLVESMTIIQVMARSPGAAVSGAQAGGECTGRAGRVGDGGFDAGGLEDAGGGECVEGACGHVARVFMSRVSSSAIPPGVHGPGGYRLAKRAHRHGRDVTSARADGIGPLVGPWEPGDVTSARADVGQRRPVRRRRGPGARRHVHAGDVASRLHCSMGVVRERAGGLPRRPGSTRRRLPDWRPSGEFPTVRRFSGPAGPAMFFEIPCSRRVRGRRAVPGNASGASSRNAVGDGRAPGSVSVRSPASLRPRPWRRR